MYALHWILTSLSVQNNDSKVAKSKQLQKNSLEEEKDGK
jgi:hypothetical protein